MIWIVLAFWIGGAFGASSAWLSDESGYKPWLSEPPILIGGALIWPFAAIYAVRHILRAARSRGNDA